MSEKSGDEQDQQNPDSADNLEQAVVLLGPNHSVDLTRLPEEEQAALMKRYAEGRIDVARRADELAVDVKALEDNLRTMAAALQATPDGSSSTFSHTQDSTAGRTEILMGNTDRAKTGKFTKSQTGETDFTPYYIIGGLIAATIVGLAIANSLGG